MIKCYECENVAASGDNYICVCAMCPAAAAAATEQSKRVREYAATIYMAKMLDEEADTTEETQDAAAADY